ncbi:hypothetical protein [Shewanella maritima]|uniref:hypothetical protein n=1 Tax=Shewanella maritima TaxID=2520507 RepID=UPI003736D8C3
MYKKWIPVSLLLFSLPASAKSLPPILDFLPSCSPIVIEGIYVEKKVTGSSNQKFIESSFNEVRKKAKEKRVDAVIITNLIQTDKLIITADLIDYCDDDDSLSSISTAYNQLSRKPIMFERSRTAKTTNTRVASTNKASSANKRVAKPVNPTPTPYIKTARVTSKPKPAPVQQTQSASAKASTIKRSISPLMTDLELAKLAAKAQIPNTNVTLSGAYGVNINNSKQFLLSVLGPASAEFTLDAKTEAWLYGRDLWFYIDNGKVKKITYKERSLLNYEGKNAILYDEDFDNTWLIDDKAQFRDDVNIVTQKLNYLQQKSTSEYTVSNHNNLLKLDFSEYSSYNDDKPELLLSGFTFHSRDYYKDNMKIEYSILNDHLLDDILVPNGGKPNIKIQDVVAQYVPNIINYSSDGSWEILSKNIRVKHEDSKITQVKLSESINHPVESNQEFLDFLNQINVPATREAMLNYYGSQAESWSEVVEVNNDSYELKAEFESEDDDAMLVSLEVQYL